VPADGLPGESLSDLAREIRDEAGESFLGAPGEPAPAQLSALGIELMVRHIRRSLADFGVKYDSWFSEKSLYDPEGAYEVAMGVLRANRQLVEREGAPWFASSE